MLPSKLDKLLRSRLFWLLGYPLFTIVVLFIILLVSTGFNIGAAAGGLLYMVVFGFHTFPLGIYTGLFGKHAMELFGVHMVKQAFIDFKPADQAITMLIILWICLLVPFVLHLVFLKKNSNTIVRVMTILFIFLAMVGLKGCMIDIR